jgi:hypothetical protein
MYSENHTDHTCESDMITVTTAKILGLMFYDQPLLLYCMFRSHMDHHQVVMNTIVIELLIWIRISEHGSSNVL